MLKLHRIPFQKMYNIVFFCFFLFGVFWGFLIHLFTISQISINLINFIDFKQQIFFLMFFCHVPFTWFTNIIYMCLFLCLFCFFFLNQTIFQIFILILMQIGLIFTFISLFSGVCWSYLSWGCFFIWDFKFIVLLFFFLLYCFFFFMKFYYTFFLEIYFKYFKNIYIFFLIHGLLFILLKYGIFWNFTMHQKENVTYLKNTLDFFIFFNLNILLIYLIFYLCIFSFFQYIFYHLAVRLIFLTKLQKIL